MMYERTDEAQVQILRIALVYSFGIDKLEVVATSKLMLEMVRAQV